MNLKLLKILISFLKLWIILNFKVLIIYSIIPIPLMIVFLILSLFVTIGVSQSSIVIANRTINTKTTYTIRIYNNSIILNSTGKTIIAFPSETYNNVQLKDVTCSFSCSTLSSNITIDNSKIGTGLQTI